MEINVNKEIRLLRLLFFAIFGGMILFFLGAYFLVKMKGAITLLTPVQMQNLESAIILLAFVGIPLSFYYHKNRLKHLSQDKSPKELLRNYRSGYLMKLAVLEGLGVLTLIAFMLSGNGTFLIIFAIFIVTIFVNYPAKSRIADDLKVSEEELFNSNINE